MEKYYLKDLYVAQIYKVFNVEKFKNVWIFDNQGRCQSKINSLKLVYKSRDNKSVIDVFTGKKYPIFETLQIDDLYMNQLLAYKSYMKPFYEFYDNFASKIIELGGNPEKYKVTQKELLNVKKNLDEIFEKSQTLSKEENIDDKEQTL